MILASLPILNIIMLTLLVALLIFYLVSMYFIFADGRRIKEKLNKNGHKMTDQEKIRLIETL